MYNTLQDPNVGVLTPAAESDGIEAAINQDRPEYYRKPISHTFHGRDIFEPIAAYLAVGRDTIELGPPIDPGDLERPPIEFTSSREKGRVRTRIIPIYIPISIYPRLPL